MLHNHLRDTRRSNLPIGTLIHEGIGLGWRQRMYREFRGKQQPLFLELMVKRLACKKEESRELRALKNMRMVQSGKRVVGIYFP